MGDGSVPSMLAMFPLCTSKLRFWRSTDAYFAFLSFKEYPLIAGLYSDVDSRGDGGAGGAVWFRSVVDPDSVPRGAAIRYMCKILNTN